MVCCRRVDSIARWQGGGSVAGVGDQVASALTGGAGLVVGLAIVAVRSLAGCSDISYSVDSVSSRKTSRQVALTAN